MPVISPFVHLLFFPPLLKKVGKDEKTECSENSRHYYCAACMAPVILSFHLCFLLYWQMVVIRQYGNTVVKIVFTDFFFPRFGIYDPMIVLRALWSWTEGQSANVVWVKKLTCATWEWCSAETLSVWVQWCTHGVRTLVLHQSVDIWLELKI